MSSRKGSRPQSSYGRERKGSGRPDSRRNLEKRAEEIEQKNTATEYSFNRHAKVKDELRRHKTEKPQTPMSRHHGDENLTEDELTQSMPERMMRLTVGDARKRDHSPCSSGSNSPLRRSFDKDLHKVGDSSPVLIRSKTIGGGPDRKGRRGSKAEISNAKLAMMKKKLSPLPSRQRLDSFGSSEDIRDHSPD